MFFVGTSRQFAADYRAQHTLDPEPSYLTWKAAAVKALQKLHWSAAAATRDAVWTNLYIRGFSPDEAERSRLFSRRSVSLSDSFLRSVEVSVRTAELSVRTYRTDARTAEMPITP
jgi:hypothetical protein